MHQQVDVPDGQLIGQSKEKKIRRPEALSSGRTSKSALICTSARNSSVCFSGAAFFAAGAGAGAGFGGAARPFASAPLPAVRSLVTSKAFKEHQAVPPCLLALNAFSVSSEHLDQQHAAGR